jgi:hypothetical protein
MPQPDVAVATMDGAYAIEVKNYQSNRMGIPAEDISQLDDAALPRMVTPVLHLKFSRRRPLILKGNEAVEHPEIAHDAFDPRWNDSGDTVYLSKPNTEEWPSASSSPDDERVLAEALGLTLTEEVLNA